jgi:uncharacterized protein (DUF924 family)
MMPETVLEFWFGSNPDDAAVAKERANLWWSKNKEADDKIRRRFEIYVILADSEQMNDWLATPRGRLALIILTDQFPRNIYRDSARAFSCDIKALTWCIEGLEKRSNASSGRSNGFSSTSRSNTQNVWNTKICR